jgi:hypothetical protein
VLAVLMLVGIALAVTAAIAADGDETAAVGALGTELGAALWFAGAVAWGARRHATAARGLLLALTFVSGLVLIAAGLLLDWSGPALELTMEFGVGMLAIPVIDVILMGVLYDRLDTFGRGSGARVLTLQLGGDARPARLCWRDERLSR